MTSSGDSDMTLLIVSDTTLSVDSVMTLLGESDMTLLSVSDTSDINMVH